jgi:L-fuculose-phosphate aldolase
MQNENATREDLERVYQRMDSLGLIFLAAGNISVRHGDGMLISPTGASAESITQDSFVPTRFDGSYDTKRRPSSEWFMHGAIYQAYSQAQAVVHTHSDYCVAVAATREALPPFHYMIASFGGHNVRCSPYLTYGSPELGRAAVDALEGRTACLLGNHGMICYGRSLAQAFNAALRMEVLCRQYVYARHAGQVQMLTSAEIDSAVERYKTYA